MAAPAKPFLAIICQQYAATTLVLPLPLGSYHQFLPLPCHKLGVPRADTTVLTPGSAAEKAAASAAMASKS
jgi:hypothetical protein